MSVTKYDHFQFMSPKESVGVTVLHAVMSDFSYSKHAHEEFAIGVTREGVQEFSCQGRWFRSFPGNIIFFNPGDVHNGNPGKDTALKYTMLYIDPKVLFPLVGSAAHDEKSDCRIYELHFEDFVLQSLVLRMAYLVNATSIATLEYEHVLYEIAKRLSQRMGTFHSDKWIKSKDALLLKVRDYIFANIAQDISIDDLSSIVHMSKYHFIRMFRTQFGLTPHQFILNHRINKAREVLSKGKSPTDVALELGFFDVSHMNRHFKRAYGVTPKQYQVQLLK